MELRMCVQTQTHEQRDCDRDQIELCMLRVFTTEQLLWRLSPGLGRAPGDRWVPTIQRFAPFSDSFHWDQPLPTVGGWSPTNQLTNRNNNMIEEDALHPVLVVWWGCSWIVGKIFRHKTEKEELRIKCEILNSMIVRKEGRDGNVLEPGSCERLS